MVSNYDMFSEGIDISSVDTVVMNRPRLTAEENIYQAIGRSSRLWNGTDESGNPVSQKEFGRIIIPELIVTNGKGVQEQVSISETIDLTRRLGKIWRDTGGQAYRDPRHDDDIGIEAEDWVGSFELIERRINMTPKQANLLDKLWTTASGYAIRDYNATHGKGSWVKVSDEARHQSVLDYITAYEGKSENLLELKVSKFRPSKSIVDRAMAYKKEIVYRRQRGVSEYLSDDERDIFTPPQGKNSARRERVVLLDEMKDMN